MATPIPGTPCGPHPPGTWMRDGHHSPVPGHLADLAHPSRETWRAAPARPRTPGGPSQPVQGHLAGRTRPPPPPVQGDPGGPRPPLQGRLAGAACLPVRDAWQASARPPGTPGGNLCLPVPGRSGGPRQPVRGGNGQARDRKTLENLGTRLTKSQDTWGVLILPLPGTRSGPTHLQARTHPSGPPTRQARPPRPGTPGSLPALPGRLAGSPARPGHLADLPPPVPGRLAGLAHSFSVSQERAGEAPPGVLGHLASPTPVNEKGPPTSHPGTPGLPVSKPPPAASRDTWRALPTNPKTPGGPHLPTSWPAHPSRDAWRASPTHPGTPGGPHMPLPRTRSGPRPPVKARPPVPGQLAGLRPQPFPGTGGRGPPGVLVHLARSSPTQQSRETWRAPGLTNPKTPGGPHLHLPGTEQAIAHARQGPPTHPVTPGLPVSGHPGGPRPPVPGHLAGPADQSQDTWGASPATSWDP
ncbi:basic salivary proline-rich protein 1-like [Macrobrachium nipponense]|uniref:basic salivary proline-rich protein 1-like n=1 Tax=Macrobrachium nipponense TaxID=159736 RepID=UPI0030C87B30